jgi:kynurenine formamidase
VHFVTSLGTYLDSPFHFDPGGDSIEVLSLEQLVLPGIVIDCPGVLAREAIKPELLEGIDISNKAVLFNTGWSRYWGQLAYYDFPFLAGETAQALKDGGAKLAGVDFLVIDDTSDPKRPVHNILLKNDILIVENLTNLDSLPESGFTFHAAPIKMRSAAAFPVRAYAVLP